MDKYPHAEACRDSLERMGVATVQMCLSQTDFGSRVGTSSASLPKKPSTCNTPSSIPVRHVEQWQTPPVPARKRPLPQFDMNLDDLFNDTLPRSRIPREPPSYPQATNILAGQRPRLPSQFQPSEYHEPTLPEPPLSLYNPTSSTMQSTSPISTAASSCHEQRQPLISLDFLDFNFCGSDPIPNNALEQTRKPDASFNSAKGAGSSNLGFGISADPQQDLDTRDDYDFLDAFLIV